MSVPSYAAWLLAACVLVGHAGLHIAAYNRMNATGLPRRVVKTVVKGLLVTCLLLPLLAIALNRDLLMTSLGGWSVAVDLTRLGGFWRWYAAVCLLALPLLGIPWLLWRPILGLEAIKLRRQVEVHDVAARATQPLALTPKARQALQIPGNQIGELAVERLDLPVVGLPAALDGYRIAHLSDLHLTGQLSPALIACAVDQANRWAPDLFALTGDLIDNPRCIAWLPDALGHAVAADGCYFVLGNHDRHMADPAQVRQAMEQLGWRDLGGRCIDAVLSPVVVRGLQSAGVPVQLLGNEAPWFPPPQLQPLRQGATTGKPTGEAAEAPPFRLLLAHSPDRLGWARRRGVQLMLAGHTHGGQGRLPLIGPVLSPSWHGSRYASGDFYKPPTTLHVSRGLSGTRLLRIRCRPELSLLTLRCAAPG